MGSTPAETTADVSTHLRQRGCVRLRVRVVALAQQVLQGVLGRVLRLVGRVVRQRLRHRLVLRHSLRVQRVIESHWRGVPVL